MLVAITESQAGTRGMFLKGESLDHTYGLSHDCLKPPPKNLFNDYDSHRLSLSLLLPFLFFKSIVKHQYLPAQNHYGLKLNTVGL